MDHTTRRKIEYLDQLVPLHGASHADVVAYTVEIPMRYAECRAALFCGGVARLADRRQLLGRSGADTAPALLLAGDQNPIILRTASQSTPSHTRMQLREKFIGVDGELIEVGPWRAVEICLAHIQSSYMSEYEAELATGARHY